MNKTILLSFVIILLGNIGMIASWQGGTPFFRCDGVYGENSYASHICFNGSILLTGMIFGISNGVGLLLFYFGYKEIQESTSPSFSKVSKD